MGAWHLEVGKMFLYVLFPVGMFHLFNQPRFENWVKESTEKHSYPSGSMNADEFKTWKRHIAELSEAKRRKEQLDYIKNEQ